MALTIGNADAQLTTAGSDILQPGSQTWFVTKATVNNTDSADHVFSAYRVPAGATAGQAVPLIYALSIPAGETDAIPISGQSFQDNQVFHVVATATGVMNISLTYAVLAG